MTGTFIKELMKKALKGGAQKTTGKEVISKIDPNVGTPSKSALNKQIQKTKASGAKLAQTLFESKNKAFKKEDKKENKTKVFNVPENFNKGGRVGLKGGSDLGMQSVKYGLDKKPEVTKLDRIAKFIAKDKKKKKKFESPIAKAISKKNKKRFV